MTVIIIPTHIGNADITFLRATLRDIREGIKTSIQAKGTSESIRVLDKRLDRLYMASQVLSNLDAEAEVIHDAMAACRVQLIDLHDSMGIKYKVDAILQALDFLIDLEDQGIIL